MTQGQQLADAYRVAAMKRFEEISNAVADLTVKKLPDDYPAQCHAAGAAAIDALLKPWWHRFVPARFRK